MLANDRGRAAPRFSSAEKWGIGSVISDRKAKKAERDFHVYEIRDH